MCCRPRAELLRPLRPQLLSRRLAFLGAKSYLGSLMKPRSSDAKSELLSHLAAHGPYEDEKGFAGGALSRALGYTAPTQTNSLLRELEEVKWVKRKMNGRRTYSIALTPLGLKNAPKTTALAKPAVPAPVALVAPEPSSPPPEQPSPALAWDMTQFAGFLKDVADKLTAQPVPAQPPSSVRLGEALSEVSKLSRDLTRVRTQYERLQEDHQAVVRERDGLRQRLRAAEDNNEKLANALPATPDRSGRATRRLMQEVPAGR